MRCNAVAVTVALAGALLGSAAQARSQDHAGHAGHGPPAAPAQAGRADAVPAALVEGEVRKVDREAGRLTLRHGPIPSLDMIAMTMVFRVADAAMLEPLKTGDKVRFAAERVGGDLTVTRIESAR